MNVEATTQTISLNFAGDVKNVPTKNVITTRLLENTNEPLAYLRKHGQNRALMNALSTNPEALKLIAGSGMLNSKWIEDKATAMQLEHVAATGAEMTKEELSSLVLSRCSGEMFERFPEVFHALQTPDTIVDLEDVGQMENCIAIVKLLIDDRQLTELEKSALNDSEFWLDQDLQEVTKVVARFREALQSRTAAN